MNSSPIGVFDSGVGGLSLLRELRRLLPNEDFIYYGDRANAPYGAKTHEEILEISKGIVDVLLSRGAKAIVVACNTATAVAIEPLRAAYPELPIIGIEPAVKPARVAGCKRVLVLATPVTVSESRFAALLRANSREGCEFIGVPCRELAFMIENDSTSEEIEEYLSNIEGVAENVVIGRKAENSDEIILTAIIYPDSAVYVNGETNEDILMDLNAKVTALNKSLPSFKQIKKVELRETEFVKTTSKKIKRNLVQ